MCAVIDDGMRNRPDIVPLGQFRVFVHFHDLGLDQSRLGNGALDGAHGLAGAVRAGRADENLNHPLFVQLFKQRPGNVGQPMHAERHKDNGGDERLAFFSHRGAEKTNIVVVRIDAEGRRCGHAQLFGSSRRNLVFSDNYFVGEFCQITAEFVHVLGELVIFAGVGERFEHDGVLEAVKGLEQLLANVFREKPIVIGLAEKGAHILLTCLKTMV